MAIRDDVTVDFNLSPRIGEIASGSSSITVQDSHDTLRDFEDDLENIGFDLLVTTAGKEDLGGGVQVGLTSTLQNFQWAFAGASVNQIGSVTTTDSTGITLIDTSGLFQTNGVKRGDWVINFTDQSVTEILYVTSETALTTRGLRNGSSDIFSSADIYKIWSVEEALLEGGNFVAIDDVDANINPVFPTFGRFISKASSSAATLQELSAIQYASFDGGVTVNVVTGVAGTAYPIGTKESPVNNISDAIIICQERGFSRLFVGSNLTLTTGHDITGMEVIGDNPTLTAMTIGSGAVTLDCEFRDMTVSGILDGNSTLVDCTLGNLNYVNGQLHHCMLTGTITLGGNATAHMVDCYSGITGILTPIVDMGTSGNSLGVRDYHGGIKIINKTGPDDISIDLSSGHIILDSTVTNGTIVCRGIAELTDNSTATVDSANLLNPSNITSHVWNRDLTNHSVADSAADNLTRGRKMQTNKAVISVDGLTVDVYDDNGSTILHTYNISADNRTRTPS